MDIRDIPRKAEIYVDVLDADRDNQHITPEMLEAFARLVASECANLDAQLKHNPNLEKFPFYRAQMAGIDILAQAIRSKFGVGA